MGKCNWDTIEDWKSWEVDGRGLGANAASLENGSAGVPRVALRENEIFIPIDATPEQVKEILGGTYESEDFIPAGHQGRIAPVSKEGESKE